MGSFSLDFPNNSIFNILGDDVTVRDTDGTELTHKGEFSIVYEGEELVDRISDEHPVIEVQAEYASLYHDGVLVMFNEEAYSYLAQHNNPNGDVGDKIIVLKEENKDIW